MSLLHARWTTCAYAALLGVSFLTAAGGWADVSGTWRVSGTSPTGTVESTVVLRQSGDSLAGTIEIARMGSSRVTGVVRGDTVQYLFMLSSQGAPLEVRVLGVLSDSVTMAGTITLANGMGSYPFTAQRQLVPR